MIEGEELDEAQRASLSTPSAVEDHPADVATETFERAKDLSIVEQLEDRLADVDRALERIEDGSYGVCEACGKPIVRERLAAIPAARFCVEDQARLEASGG
ncbi:MAG TPA: TraR/DksA C4-type zinc finger protein [Actinomycetota bacterium]